MTSSSCAIGRGARFLPDVSFVVSTGRQCPCPPSRRISWPSSWLNSGLARSGSFTEIQKPIFPHSIGGSPGARTDLSDLRDQAQLHGHAGCSHRCYTDICGGMEVRQEHDLLARVAVARLIIPSYQTRSKHGVFNEPHRAPRNADSRESAISVHLGAKWELDWAIENVD